MKTIIVWGSIVLSFVGCSSGQSIITAPTPTPVPPVVTSPTPAPTPAPQPPAAVPTTVDVSVLVARQDGRPIAAAEISIDGVYRGQTDSAGRLALGTLTIGQSYRVDVYQGEYTAAHDSRTAALDVSTWSYVLTSIR